MINKVLQYGRGMNVKVGMPQITMMRTAISDLMLEKGIAREAGAIAGLSHIEALVVAAENRKFISLRGEKTHIP
ncbi:MAG TPA: hypothetical protein PKW15_04715 [Alphaproteobacteria bacterium]|nr:hypothetical protein [Alphaproteobacteria bacterium]